MIMFNLVSYWADNNVIIFFFVGLLDQLNLQKVKETWDLIKILYSVVNIFKEFMPTLFTYQQKITDSKTVINIKTNVKKITRVVAVSVSILIQNKYIWAHKLFYPKLWKF